MQLDTQIWQFSLLNLLIILVFGIIYFVLKEFSRLSGGNLSGRGVFIIGSMLGVVIMLVYLFVSMEILVVPITSSRQSLNYNSIYLTPALFLVVAFGVFFDRRSTFPIMFFLLVGYLITFPWDTTTNANSDIWIKLIFDWISYGLIVLMLFFTPNGNSQSNNLIKNNGTKMATAIFGLILIIFLKDTLYFATIRSINFDYVGNTLLKQLSIKLVYAISFLIPFLFFIWIIEKVYDNFNKLETYSIRDDISYYKMSLAQNNLLNLI